jgi:hypothetical protein
MRNISNDISLQRIAHGDFIYSYMNHAPQIWILLNLENRKG